MLLSTNVFSNNLGKYKDQLPFGRLKCIAGDEIENLMVPTQLNKLGCSNNHRFNLQRSVAVYRMRRKSSEFRMDESSNIYSSQALTTQVLYTNLIYLHKASIQRFEVKWNTWKIFFAVLKLLNQYKIRLRIKFIYLTLK